MVSEAPPTRPLVADPGNIRLAMLGMVPGNGHPFSWSAIINGRYNREKMADCGYPVIPEYLGAQPPQRLGIPGCEVTHVWCDQPHDTPRVAEACHIAHRLDRPEDAIGRVDAAFVATDLGHEHVRRARPFIEAGVPLFIDKPMADRAQDLAQFIRWQRQGKAFHSSSGMLYSPPYVALRERLGEVGRPRLITMTMVKRWPSYGMHAIAAVYPLLRPNGWRCVRTAVEGDAWIVHASHDDGVEVLMPTIADMSGGFGRLSIHGTAGSLAVRSDDTFAAFRAQLASFIEYLRTGLRPFPFDQLVEQNRLLIAGIESAEQGGRPIEVASIAADEPF